MTLQTEIAFGFAEQRVGIRAVRIVTAPAFPKLHRRMRDRTGQRLRDIVMALQTLVVGLAF